MSTPTTLQPNTDDVAPAPGQVRGPVAVGRWARTVFGRGTAGYEWAAAALVAHDAGEPLPPFPARRKATRDARVATFWRLMGE